MKIQNIINKLTALGIYLYMDSSSLRFRDHKKAMTSEILTLLRQHKPQICSLLKVGNPYNLPMVIKPSKTKRFVANLLFWSVRWMQLFLSNPNYKMQSYIKYTAKTKRRTRKKKKMPNGGAYTRVIRDDSNNSLDRLPANSLDAIITDPPYGLWFMGKKWDKDIPAAEIWKKCFRVLKPGAWMVVFSSPRQDLLSKMILSLAEAGFDTNFTSLYWTYASGFSKARNIEKHLHKKGLHREAEQLEGAYAGFQPKPAVEVIIVAMKPLEEKSYTAQALSNGKGVTQMDDCRIPYGENEMPSIGNRHKQGRGGGYGYKPPWKAKGGVQWSPEKEWKQDIERQAHEKGRFPANLLVSGDILDDGRPRKAGSYSNFFSLDAWAKKNLPFLIVPKPSSKEKNEGLEDREPTVTSDGRKKPIDNPYLRGKTKRHNNHPTVKPLELICYLLSMFTRPGDTVGDIFAGTGTTCQAAQRMGRESIGIEISPEYFNIMEKKLKARAIDNYQGGGAENESTSVHDLHKDNPKIKWKAEELKITNKANANNFKGWEKVLVTTSSGDKKKVASPVIISASRRSDIPAWHSEWFMNGFRIGHIKYQLRGNWYYVSFENARCIVLWTKNPKPMIKYLEKIDQMGIGYYFTHTLNNYEKEGLEPGLPVLNYRIDTFQELSEKIGKEKVIWRFDPLIVADKISKEVLIDRIGSLMEHLAGYTEKFVFSFLDPNKYNAKNKLKRVGVEAKPFSSDDKRFFAKHIATMAEKHNIQAASCSEGMNFLSYGIIPNKCIDGELIRKLFRKDRELMRFIKLNGLEHHVQGQNCGCIQSYDVGIENTCKNGCAYCYANASKKAVESNLRRISNYGIKM